MTGPICSERPWCSFSDQNSNCCRFPTRSPAAYFGRAGALRKLTRSPTSVAFRVGQGRPNCSARSIMRGPCRQRAAVKETVEKASVSDLSPGQSVYLPPYGHGKQRNRVPRKCALRPRGIQLARSTAGSQGTSASQPSPCAEGEEEGSRVRGCAGASPVRGSKKRWQTASW